MRFSVLGSGSRGNATLVAAGSTLVLIDNGFSGKELIARLSGIGIEPSALTALIVTHAHDDHVKGVGVLARRLGLPVWANDATHRAAEKRVGRLPQALEFATGEPFAVGCLDIHPFAVSHDCADPVGFVLRFGDAVLGYCTDTGRITRLIEHQLRQCQAVILEANHDVRMLKDGPYPQPLKQRVLSGQGHLANADALAFAARLAEGRLGQLVLAHMSEINNHPDLVLAAIREHLPPRERLRVELAYQDRHCALRAVGDGRE